MILKRGLTLIEVLIATTLTMLLMLALAQGFKTLSNNVSEGRAKINLSDQLRGVLSILKIDLSQRTTDGHAPQSPDTAKGYFKILDGPLSDFTALRYNQPVQSAMVRKEDLLGGSKWGDIDDILMFTARATPGEFFRGKVPRALLRFNEMNRGITPPAGINWQEEWATDVTITSELAEIVWFMVPIRSQVALGIDSGIFVPSTVGIDAVDIVGYVDIDRNGITEPDGIPDRLALCRRVLLIRDDLDITPPAGFRSYASDADTRLFQMQPEWSVSSLGSFRQVMQNAYRRCDLSVTTEHLQDSNGGNYLAYKTNSLSTLQDPINRFAHGVYPLPDNSGGGTLPFVYLSEGLSITASVRSQMEAISGTNLQFANDSGFIPADFFRIRYIKDQNGNVRIDNNVRIKEFSCEEFVATNVVGFDLKVFDPTAPSFFHPGPDDGWGIRNFDDNGNNNVDEISEAGWRGTDDVAVNPSDPGFWEMMVLNQTQGIPLGEANRGGYVDLGWGFKGLGERGMLGLTSSTAIQNNLISEFSGLRLNSNANLMVAPDMRFSGSLSLTTQFIVFQTVFDSFTSQYDSDGETDFSGPDALGANASFPNYRTYWKGLQRFAPGLAVPPANIGDPLRVDVPPPIASRLHSFQTTIRVQDLNANAIQQVSLVHAMDD